MNQLNFYHVSMSRAWVPLSHRLYLLYSAVYDPQYFSYPLFFGVIVFSVIVHVYHVLQLTVMLPVESVDCKSVVFNQDVRGSGSVDALPCLHRSGLLAPWFVPCGRPLYRHPFPVASYRAGSSHKGTQIPQGQQLFQAPHCR